ncbi:NYN domain-containing protein [Candidatus Flexifilum breve]|uniref:NYN domain-containing protein n=1 Tax=Candidatus Flexifilum breve TaxID=3140694 RepID=UPI0031CCC838
MGACNWQTFPNTCLGAEQHERQELVDITLVVDAMTLLYERPDLTGFCIVSSDADFTALAKHVQTKDKYVLGIGKAVTPESFRNACSDFVCLDEPTTPTTPVESISEAVLSPLIELPDSDFLDLAIKAYKQVSGAESRIGRVPARVLRESMLQLNQGYHPNAKLTVERLKKLAVSSPIIIQLHEETDGKTAIHWVRIYEDTPIDRLRRAYHFVIEDKRFTYEDGWVALAAIGEALQTLYPSVEPLEYKGVKQPKKVVQKLTQDYHEIVDLRYDAQQHPYVYFKN